MAARLEVRRNFFSNRVIDSLEPDTEPSDECETVSSFKHSYKPTKPDCYLPHTVKEYESGDETEKWRGQLNKDTS
jgi:hypothetical protein